MIDCSDKPLEENIDITKYVVSLCAPLGISVEGEVGVLGGVEDGVGGSVGKLTDPEEALKYAELTGIDALAPAVGTAHGPFKYREEPFIDINLIEEIKSKLNMPLVLHGGGKKCYGSEKTYRSGNGRGKGGNKEKNTALRQ